VINPNICKLITVEVLPLQPGLSTQFARYKGQVLPISDMVEHKPGNRRLYLKYSIFNDRYYLTKRG